MTWSTFLLFVHVAMAVIWIGGGLMMQLFGMRAAMLRDPVRMANLGPDIEWIANRTFIPASLIAFFSGILLVVDSDFYGFGDDWIVIGLALYAIDVPLRSSLSRAGVGAGREAQCRALTGGRAANASADHAGAARPRAAVPDHLRHDGQARLRRCGLHPVGCRRGGRRRRADLLAVPGRDGARARPHRATT